jgi:hypothetical protein
MKRFIVIISAFFCLSIAQDIAGSWTLTAVDVWYYNFARPNVATADEAFGEYQYQTPLYVNDTYGLGASLPLAWLPPGYMFLGVPNGPYGEGGLAANGVNLNVTLETDGTGTIPEGSTYPDIELDEELCVTYGQVLPVTDEVIYSSDKDAGVTLPTTDIMGQPSRNRYAGETMGSMSLSQSVVFSFFPQIAVPDYLPFPLYFDATTPATSFTPNEQGLFQTVGTTGGYIKTDGFDGSIGDDGPLSGGDNADPELALYWHSVDGFSADTGLGDDPAVDEDGDGTPYDRIFGLPAISATYLDPTCAAGFGFNNFNHLVAGDIQEGLTELVYGGCIGMVSAEVSGLCGQVLAGGIAECMAATGYDADTCAAVVNGGAGGAAGATVSYLAGTIVAAMDPPLLDTCLGTAAQFGDESLAVAAVVNGLCLGAGFEQESCDDLVALVTIDYGVQDCATLDANSGVLVSAAGGLVDSADEDGSGDNCGEWALSVADSFAAQSADTGFMTCTDYSAATVAACSEVTLTDDYEDPAMANTIYVMNPDPAYALWNNFVTFNAYAYGLTGNEAFLVNDSGHELDFENDFTFISLATGLPCDPTSGDPYCAPYSSMGGRLVFEYAPTCVPVVEAMEVQTEFIGIADGECTNDGDVDGDTAVTVLDIVAVVQAVLGNSTLSDEEACRADIDGDSAVTVLDIVSIVQVILNSRGEAATSAEFMRVGDTFEMNADGIVDAVQITLSHGNDFSIELTDNALVADYATKNNQTTLIVVAPEGKEIFTANGEYVIEEVAAANTNGYIETSMPVSFNLSEAYPNPFNPSTSLDITLSNEGSVSIMAYNVMGQMVGTLHEGNMSAGNHTIAWDASSLASGMYIIKAEVAGNIVSKKVMLLK